MNINGEFAKAIIYANLNIYSIGAFNWLVVLTDKQDTNSLWVSSSRIEWASFRL